MRIGIAGSGDIDGKNDRLAVSAGIGSVAGTPAPTAATDAVTLRARKEIAPLTVSEHR